MSLESFYAWQESTRIATVIRENELLFPLIESIHVLSIALVFGTIAAVDLHLLGFGSRERRMSELMAQLLPLTWAAFVVAAVTGTLLFCSNATVYGRNFYFNAKIVLMVLAGLNMLAFHLFVGRGAARWDASAGTPWGAKLAGGTSLAIWVAVVTCGRWIGFTMIGGP
jgi:hypothetical protein